MHGFYLFIKQVFGSSRALCVRKDGPRSGVDAMKSKSQAKALWIRRGDAGAWAVTVIQFTLSARGIRDNTPVSRY